MKSRLVARLLIWDCIIIINQCLHENDKFMCQAPSLCHISKVLYNTWTALSTAVVV